MAEACLHFLQISPQTLEDKLPADQPPLINIGCGEDLTILELAQKVKAIVGYQGEIVLDSTKPDGTMRKLLDVSLAKNLGWQATLPLQTGIHSVYQQYLSSL